MLNPDSKWEKTKIVAYLVCAWLLFSQKMNHIKHLPWAWQSHCPQFQNLSSNEINILGETVLATIGFKEVFPLDLLYCSQPQFPC